MSRAELFFETQPAFTALTRLLEMAREQEDYEGIVEISHGLAFCESVVEHLFDCYQLEDAMPAA